jgi:hypothetical protein
MRHRGDSHSSSVNEMISSALCSLPALQDLAPVWRSLLAATSDVPHIGPSSTCDNSRKQHRGHGRARTHKRPQAATSIRTPPRPRNRLSRRPSVEKIMRLIQHLALMLLLLPLWPHSGVAAGQLAGAAGSNQSFDYSQDMGQNRSLTAIAPLTPTQPGQFFAPPSISRKYPE